MEKMCTNGLSIPKDKSSKIEAVETALHQTIYNFRDLVTEIEQMHLETESIKKQISAQNEKCNSKCCSGSEELKKVIESKNSLLEVIASTLTKLNETQNLSLLAELFKIIFGDSKLFNNNIANKQDMNITTKDVKEMSVSSNEELTDISVQEEDDSVSEIAGTPTGRRSPIIQSRKLKSSTPNSTNLRDKKKCPENWSTPEKKSYKLTYPTPTSNKGSGRLKQQRLCLVKVKPSNVVDLTTSPQFSGRTTQEECLVNIKPEVIENDDTIFPSPTSGPIFPILFKSLTEKSPQKFKKPLSLIRGKADKTKETDLIENIKPDIDATNFTQLDDSVNLLKEYNNGFISPKKCKSEKKSPIQANESVSLLQHINNIELKNCDKQCNSPSKRPLVENLNVNNIPCDSDSSMSILRRDVKIIQAEPFDEITKRSKSEILQPIYKEPTVRKKADKKALPGWSCDECKNFYSEIYKDKPEMLVKMMDECSKHRGKNNPVRPKTPPGFWNPRWDVPEGTEEFNRRNNAI